MNDQISIIVTELYELFKEKDKVRERLLQLNRDLTRKSGLSIQSLISGDVAKSEQYLKESEQLIKDINNVLTEFPDFEGWGGISSGIEEYCEAKILHSIVKNTDLPTPEKLSVPPDLFLLGLADVPGELKRLMLMDLIKGDLNKAKKYVELIQTFYTALVGFDFSKGQISSLRKKIDRVRYIMEQAERDFATSYISITLRNQLKEKENGV